MTTLVTGATGFIGSAVVRRLLRYGHAVRVLVRSGSDMRNLRGLDVQPVFGDLTDRPALERAVAGCAALLHVAADYRLWVPDPRPMYRTNVLGTIDILRAAADAGVRRMVYTSTVGALGLTADGTAADELTPVRPKSMVGHYKRSKYMAEMEVRRLAREQGLPVVIVNPSAPVGPRDIKPTPTGRMILEAVRGTMPAYVDTGLNIVHVDDVAEGHCLALARGTIGERYILGGENMTLKDILAIVCIEAKHRPPRIRLPHLMVLPIAFGAERWARFTGAKEPLVTVDGVLLARKKMFFSHQKSRRELGYLPRPATEALRDAVRWFREEFDRASA